MSTMCRWSRGTAAFGDHGRSRWLRGPSAERTRRGGPDGGPSHLRPRARSARPNGGTRRRTSRRSTERWGCNTHRDVSRCANRIGELGPTHSITAHVEEFGSNCDLGPICEDLRYGGATRTVSEGWAAIVAYAGSDTAADPFLNPGSAFAKACVSPEFDNPGGAPGPSYTGSPLTRWSRPRPWSALAPMAPSGTGTVERSAAREDTGSTASDPLPRAAR